MSEYNTPWLSIENVTRKYGDKVALDSLSFEVKDRGIVGFLGRNGAGKSTLLRIITGQDLPTSGKVRIFGQDPFDNAQILSRLCVVQDHPEFGALRSAHELLSVSRAIYPKWDDELSRQLLVKFELDPKKKLKALSRGMHTAFALLVGLASGAELTLFDEPSLGLDAVLRERFYDILIKTRQKTDRCFLVSTHLIEEAARTLDTVRMIEDGKLLASGTVNELVSRAFTITGQIIPDLPGVRILRRDVKDGMTILTCEGLRPDPPPPNTIIASVSLQRLFVLLTDGAQDSQKEV